MLLKFLIEMTIPKKFSYKGERLTLREISEKYSVNRLLLTKRVFALEWPIHKAVTTPARPIKRKSITDIRTDEGIESWHFLMMRYFTREHRIKCYKKLSLHYNEFKSEANIKAA